jgi:hypothetical protein
VAIGLAPARTGARPLTQARDHTIAAQRRHAVLRQAARAQGRDGQDHCSPVPSRLAFANAIANALFDVAILCGTGQFLVCRGLFARRASVVLAFGHERLESSASQLLFFRLCVARCHWRLSNDSGCAENESRGEDEMLHPDLLEGSGAFPLRTLADRLGQQEEALALQAAALLLSR